MPQTTYSRVEVSPTVGGPPLAVLLQRTPAAEVFPPATRFVVGPDEPLQTGVLYFREGAEAAPHAHYARGRPTAGTQETLVFVDGGAVLTIYDPPAGYTWADRPPDAVWPVAWEGIVSAGDVVCLLRGGHSLRFLAPSTVLEVKSGPYPGKDADKFLIPTGG